MRIDVLVLVIQIDFVSFNEKLFSRFDSLGKYSKEKEVVDIHLIFEALHLNALFYLLQLFFSFKKTLSLRVIDVRSRKSFLFLIV